MGKNAEAVILKRDGSSDAKRIEQARLTAHPEIREGKCLNLGCGFTKWIGWTNVDKYSNCEPDMVHDLDVFPYPWKDGEFHYIYANHVFEHLHNWWGAFQECARILDAGGHLEMRVPDESSSTALTYRDHVTVFSLLSFHGIGKRDAPDNLWRSGTNAWAREVEGTVPLELRWYHRVPYRQYTWMRFWPFRKILRFCGDHMRNFVHEQQFIFRKYELDREA